MLVKNVWLPSYRIEIDVDICSTACSFVEVHDKTHESYCCTSRSPQYVQFVVWCNIPDTHDLSKATNFQVNEYL